MNADKQKRGARAAMHALVLIVPAALLLIREFRTMGGFFSVLQDAQLYLSIADNVLETGHFIQTARDIPGFIVPPGLPLILTILRLLRCSLDGIRIFQILLFGISCVLLYETERKITGFGGIAPVVYALAYAKCDLYFGNIFVEHYYAFFMCLLLFFIFRDIEYKRKTRILMLISFFAVLIRPVLFPVFLAVTVWSVYTAVKYRNVRPLLTALLIALTVICVLMCTNYRETGEFILIENYDGVDVYMASLPNSSVDVNDSEMWKDPVFAGIYYNESLTMSERSTLLRQAAKENISRNPALYYKHAALRFKNLFLRTYRYSTAVLALAFALIVTKTEKRKGVYTAMLLMNILLAAISSFGVPATRYTVIIWPAAALQVTLVAGWICRKILQSNMRTDR